MGAVVKVKRVSCPPEENPMIVARNVAARATRAATRAGFTLMEVMVVVAIIVILAGVGAVAVNGYLERSKVDATKIGIATVEKAVQAYYNDNRVYPETLRVLLESPGAGLPAYLEQKDLVDEWGREIQ